MHLWHDVKHEINEKDKTFLGIIEIPKGSSHKYELNKDYGIMQLGRMLSMPVEYPENYGFIPQTYCDDKDPLDILVLSEKSIAPSTLVTVRPIGVMKMVDGGEKDDKLICVHASDPIYESCYDIKDLPKNLKERLKRFFECYKNFENKKVKIDKFFGQKEAWRILKESIDMYEKSYKGKK